MNCLQTLPSGDTPGGPCWLFPDKRKCLRKPGV